MKNRFKRTLALYTKTYMCNFVEHIFSIKKVGINGIATHKEISILGIKIKIKR